MMLWLLVLWCVGTTRWLFFGTFLLLVFIWSFFSKFIFYFLQVHWDNSKCRWCVVENWCFDAAIFLLLQLLEGKCWDGSPATVHVICLYWSGHCMGCDVASHWYYSWGIVFTVAFVKCNSRMGELSVGMELWGKQFTTSLVSHCHHCTLASFMLASLLYAILPSACYNLTNTMQS